MQRYSDGVRVPKVMTEVFTGKTTSAGGVVSCTLKYAPKNPNAVTVMYGLAAAAYRNRHLMVIAVTGKTVSVYIWKSKYYKADTPTGVDVGSSGAPANHSHAISSTHMEVDTVHADSEAQPAITIIYEV